MSQIALREPPPRIATGRRPIMPLDQAILAAAETVRRPVEIANTLRASGDWPNLTTQRVASRLKSLVGRDLAVRIKPQGGPANGPGASLYRRRRPKDDRADG
jgi:hypothetical protein